MAALKGILCSCAIVFVIFMTWFVIREKVFDNKDDLGAVMVQMVVCAALLLAGCITSIVKAFADDTELSPEQEQPPTMTGKNQRK
jgi:hypothetical protein